MDGLSNSDVRGYSDLGGGGGGYSSGYPWMVRGLLRVIPVYGYTLT